MTRLFERESVQTSFLANGHTRYCGTVRGPNVEKSQYVYTYLSKLLRNY